MPGAGGVLHWWVGVSDRMVAVTGVNPFEGVEMVSIVDQPGWIRGVLAFALVLVLGTIVTLRFDDIIEDSIEASITRPAAALGYGIAAHLTIVFIGLYLTNQLRYISFSGASAAVVGPLVGIALLVVIGSVGFTVTGTAIAETLWNGERYHGVLLGAAMAGIAAFLDPLLGALVWVVTVSLAVGGPIRHWVHASRDVTA